jgi:hypothetical protein
VPERIVTVAIRQQQFRQEKGGAEKRRLSLGDEVPWRFQDFENGEPRFGEIKQLLGGKALCS